MSSALELLATELLDDILGALDRRGNARLLQCSKLLRHRIEPSLYGRMNVRNDAMLHACLNGNLPTIRLVVSYGAVISYVFPKIHTPFTISTLHLAARGGHANAFALLLEMGARIDQIQVQPIQQKAFMKRLYKCSPVSQHILRQFLKAGLGAQLRSCFQDQPEFDISLVSLIQHDAPPELVKAFLDDGCPVNRLEKTGQRLLVSPLTAAIMANSIPMANLLLERGADINGKNVYFIPRKDRCYNFEEADGEPPEYYAYSRALHIPVFAAAWKMVQNGTAMMEWCLNNGADINSLSHLMHKRTSYYTPCWKHTPVFTYLDSLQFRKSFKKLKPIEGLQYLVEHGAKLEVGELPRVPKPSQYWIPHVTTTVEFLLDKWGLLRLNEPGFFATIQYLVENQGFKGLTEGIFEKFLLRYSWNRVLHDWEDSSGWKKFMDLLLSHNLGPEDNNHLLFSLIVRLCSRPDTLGVLERSAVESLIKTGANINMGRPGFEKATALNQVCSVFINDGFGNYHICKSHHTEDDLGDCAAVLAKCKFLSYLLKSGADPNIGLPGRTAIDILRDKKSTTSGVEKIYCWILLNVLQGKDGLTYKA
ncbi:hypothetical protein B0J14DRAFT_66456 [Halenospora varia]|nr:hypothetical protein B0J14DRAFT_66456 [Halenospora varia]